MIDSLVLIVCVIVLITALIWCLYGLFRFFLHVAAWFQKTSLSAERGTALVSKEDDPETESGDSETPHREIFYMEDNKNNPLPLLSGENQRFLMKLKNSTWLRVFVIFFIIQVLLIPLELVDSLVSERSHLQQDTVRSITDRWGKTQAVSGPVLLIPYDTWVEKTRTHMDATTDKIIEEKYMARSEILYLVVLPKRLDIQAAVEPIHLYYGIYKYMVYDSSVAISGQFTLPKKEDFGRDVATVYLADTIFSVGVSSLYSLSSATELSWNGQPQGPFSPGSKFARGIGDGFHVTVGAQKDFSKSADFSLELKLKGARSLSFTPVAEVTDLVITGNWENPSFKGDLSPNTREIKDNYFKAVWSIPHLSRSYPQVGSVGSFINNNRSEIQSFVAGVDIYEPVTLYRCIDRSIKYALLFIGLTFAMLFGLEFMRRERLHFLQYGMVGVSMCVFYLVLLSLAEHTSFSLSFAIASAITVVMNGSYIAAALKSLKQGGLVGLTLSLLYGALYLLLHLESYALVVGTCLVLIVVGILMYVTRHLPVAKL